jgi:hypothetical protein
LGGSPKQCIIPLEKEAINRVSAGITVMRASLAHALEDLHTRIAETVLNLDEAALRWRPAPGVSSVYDLVVRAAAEERRWIAEGVMAAPSAGGADPAFDDKELLTGHPLHHLGRVGQISQTILATLPPSAWASRRQVDGQTVTVAGCVLHALEDLARTLGQIEVIVLWGEKSRWNT